MLPVRTAPTRSPRRRRRLSSRLSSRIRSLQKSRRRRSRHHGGGAVPLRGLRAPGQERRQPLKTRTSEKTVPFRKPFALTGLDEVLPDGIYSVDTEEELVDGISNPAYRRTATVLRIHAASTSEEPTSE